MNSGDGVLLTPIVVACVDANIVHEVEFLKVLIRLEVDFDLLQLIVVDRHYLENVIILEEVCFDDLDAVV